MVYSSLNRRRVHRHIVLEKKPYRIAYMLDMYIDIEDR